MVIFVVCPRSVQTRLTYFAEELVVTVVSGCFSGVDKSGQRWIVVKGGGCACFDII